MNYRLYWRLAASPGLFLLALLTFIAWYEWYRIGVVADPDVIAGYYFGSEAMIGHGGKHYASAAMYARSALFSGFFLTPVLAAFLVAEIKGERKYTLASYVLFGFAIALNWLL